MTFFLIASLVKILVVFTVIMVGVALITLFERRVCAFIQDRLGPNRVGPFGLLQPIADGLKNFLKEETLSRPPPIAGSSFWPPAIAFVPALVTFAVIPFAAPLPTRWGEVPTWSSPTCRSASSTSWRSARSACTASCSPAGRRTTSTRSSDGLRASAQMVTYEIALGLSLIPVLLLAGNVTLTEVVAKQQGSMLHGSRSRSRWRSSSS